MKDVNVIVSVVDRGAVVGGPVTSEDIKKRVESVIRDVPGVESVKNVCFVQSDPDPLVARDGRTAEARCEALERHPLCCRA